MLTGHVIALDWKLLYRALRRDGRQNLLVAFLAAAVLRNTSSSASDLGTFLRAEPLSNGAMIFYWIVWAAAAGAFAAAFLSGHVASGHRLSESLRLAGARPAQMFKATLVRYFFARQALANIVILVPVVSFVAAWLPADRTAVITAGLFLLLAACSSAASAISYLSARGRFVALALCALAAATLLAPSLRPFVVNALRSVPAVLAVALGTALLLTTAALEAFLAQRHESADAVTFRGSKRFAYAVLSRHPLFGRELLYALRWPRLLGLWLLGNAIVVVLVTKLPAHGPFLPKVALSLLPSIFLASFFSNLFGSDGAGYESYWLLPLRPASPMDAKVLALMTLALVSLLISWSAMFLAGALALPPLLLFYIVLAGIGFTVWLAAVGRIASVLFPRGVDPVRISGDSLSPTATFVIGIACSLYLLLTGGAAMLYDFRRIGAPALAITGVLIVLAVAVLHLLAARAAATLMKHRREEILGSLLAR